MVLMVIAGVAGNNIRVQDMDPAVQFEHTGVMHNEVLIGHLIITFDVDHLRGQLEEFSEALRNKTESAAASSGRQGDILDLSGIVRRVERLQAELEDDMSFFNAHSREKHGIGGWIGSLLGFFNGWEIHRLEGKLDGTRRAIKAEVEEVEAIRYFTSKTEVNLESVAKEVSLLGDQALSARSAALIMDRWRAATRPVRALTVIAAELVHHKLATEIMEIVDVGELWAQFVANQELDDWETAIDSYQYLFNMPLSFRAANRGFQIAIHVPMRRRTAPVFHIWAQRHLPFWHADQIYEVMPIREEMLAIHNGTGVHAVLTREDVAQCTRILDEYYCDSAMVTYQEEASGCAMSLWRGDWDRAAKSCIVWTRPARTEAWRLNATAFVVISPVETAFQVICTGVPAATEAIQGYQLVCLDGDCMAISEELTLRVSKRIEAGTKTKVMVGAEGMFNLTSDEDKKWEKPERPTVVQSRKAEIEEDLRLGQGGPGAYTLLAIAIAASAVVIVIGFVAFLYWKAARGGEPIELLEAGKSVLQSATETVRE